MKKFIITEEERNHIKGLYEQKTNTTQKDTSFLIGKTFNVYGDENNQNQFATVTIEKVHVSKPGQVYFWVKANDPEVSNPDAFSDFYYGCSQPNKIFRHKTTDNGWEANYSNNLTKELEKTFCSRSTGGTIVPKADFTQTTTPQSPTDLA